jgi:hypothetical protein
MHLHTDHCTQCGARFRRRDTLYMVQRDVPWSWSAFEGTTYSTVPVCEVCIKDSGDFGCDYDGTADELEITYFAPGLETAFERACEGCGRRMLTPRDAHYIPTVCSTRCAQRVRRRHRQQQRPKIACGVCKTMFRPKRADAAYCSSGCRQKAYRTRLRAA